MDLGEIEKLTKEYADSRATVAGRVGELNEAIDNLKRRSLPLIKHAVATAMERKSKLETAIQGRPELFKSPRTVVLFGIKVGMQKGKGAIEWDDDDQVVRLIEKHFPDLADTLIKTRKTPVKTTLGQLTVAELRKLGITVAEGGDQVVIKPADSDVDKLVSKLLEEDKEGDKA